MQNMDVTCDHPGVFDEDAPIALDRECTWPPEVLKLLQSNVMAQAGNNALTEQLDAQVQHRSIVGYQCTRLHADEIARLESEDLFPLTPALQRGRIQRRVDAGDLPYDLAKILLQESLAGDQRSRGGLLHFLLTKEVPDSFWHFFRYWGGEALYLPHIHNSGEIEHALRSIGCPCILEVTIPISALGCNTAANGLIYSYLVHRGVPNVREAGTHGTVTVPARVHRIVRYGSDDFQDFIGTVSWPRPIHP